MPNSTDNQDYSENEVQKEDKKASNTETATGPAMGNLALTAKEDENNFTSDDQKGKKVDADPEKESDKPIKQ